jgi:hypothetical protein
MASEFNLPSGDGPVTIRLPELLLGQFIQLVTEFEGLLLVGDRDRLVGARAPGFVVNDTGGKVTHVEGPL